MAAPRKRWRRALTLVVGVPLTVLVVAVALLHTGWGKSRVKGVLVAKLAERVDGTVAIGALDYRLGGTITVRDVRLTGRDGVDAITLPELEIVPEWGALLRGKNSFKSITLRHLAVTVARGEDGRTNLQRLFPARETAPTASAKPGRPLHVGALRVEDATVVARKEGAGSATVRDLGIEGSIDLDPAEKTVDFVASSVKGGVVLEGRTANEPSAVPVTQVAPTDLRGGFEVHTRAGKGAFTLLPLTATATLTRGTSHTLPISLGKSSFDLGPSEAGLLGANVGALVTGIVSLDAVRFANGVGDGGPADPLTHERHGDLLGLHVDAGRVNAIVGREILASDVDITAQLSGPPEATTFNGTAKSGGATATLKGQFGLDGGNGTVTIANFDSTKLFGAGVLLPPTTLERLTVVAHGKRRDRTWPLTPADVTADFEIQGENGHFRGVALESLAAKGRFAEGTLTVESLTAKALGQEVSVRGTVVPTDRTVDLTLATSGDVGTTLEALRAAGIPVKAKLPVGLLRLRPATPSERGDLELHITGTVPKGPGTTPDLSLDGHVTLNHVPLAALAPRLGAKAGTVSGTVMVGGTTTAPTGAVDLRVTVGERHETIRGSLRPGGASLAFDGYFAQGNASIPLLPALRGLDPNGRLTVTLAVPEAVLPPALDGTAALDLRITGTPTHPEGRLTVRAHANRFKDLNATVTAVLAPAARGVTLTTTVRTEGDAPASGEAEVVVSLPHSPFMTRSLAGLTWTARVDAATASGGPTSTGREPLHAALHAALAGDLRDARGKIHAETSDLPLPGTTVSTRASVDVTLSDREIAFTAAAAPVFVGPPSLATLAVANGRGPTKELQQTQWLAVGGTVGLGGLGLVTALRTAPAELRARATSAPLAATVELPARPLAAFAPFAPALEGLSGDLAGKFLMTGTVATPLLHGDVTAGRAALTVDADADDLHAKGTFGPKITVDVSAPRDRSKGRTLSGTLRADHAEIAEFLPAFRGMLAGATASGTLDGALTFQAELPPAPSPTVLHPTLTGNLGLTGGRLALPTRGPVRTRAYEEITVALVATPEALRLERLSAVERDREIATPQGRTLTAQGNLTWTDLRPTSGTLDLAAEKWLLFGTDGLGLPDAPRGVASLTAHGEADLRGPVPKFQVAVQRLDVAVENRFDKAHQPEKFQVGDVIELASGTALCKLPVPVPPPAPLPTPVATPEKPTGKPSDAGFDLDVTVAKGARFYQFPIALEPSGSVAVRVRPTEKSVRGVLGVDNGAISIGGVRHPLVHGAITFDDAHPVGNLDFLFARPLRPSALRDISQASGGDAVTVHLFGPPGKQTIVLGGAGSPGALWDALAMHNQGRPRFHTEPDLPASNSAQFPQLDGVLILSFLTVNMPHMIFLDRVAAWADPYDRANAYGRLERYEAERAIAGGKGRVAVTGRPLTAGQSRWEAEIDYLFVHGLRTRAGVGLTGGTRGGGGPDVFFEWSSDD